MIELENLTLGYDKHPAVHHLDLKIEKGGLWAIIGPNGAGKSTLLKGLAGILLPLGGEIRINRQDVAYLPQQVEVERDFPINVSDMVMMGLWKETGAFGGFSARHKERITQALEKVGLKGLEKRGIGTLSGGQMQRALFARLWLQDAGIILLDEPFSAIDSATVADLMELLKLWQAEGRTVIAVLHDLELVKAHFPHTLLLGREKVAAGITLEVVREENLGQAQRLCQSYEEERELCRQ